jgi:hypothetical protein
MITIFTKNKMFLLLYYRLIIGITIPCCIICSKQNVEKNWQLFKILQSDIQRIANEEIMTNNNVIFSKWTIEEIDDRESAEKFKVHI